MNTLNLIIALGAAAASLGYFASKFIKLFKTWFTFIQDWNGDGTEENPGIVERLKQGDKRFDKIEEELCSVKAELFNNHGTSLRDAIDRIEKNTSPRQEN